VLCFGRERSTHSESSPLWLAFPPETFLCSRGIHATGDTSVLLPALPQPRLGVLVQDTLSVSGHGTISKPEPVGWHRLKLPHPCTHLEPPLGSGHQKSPALCCWQQDLCTAASPVRGLHRMSGLSLPQQYVCWRRPVLWLTPSPQLQLQPLPAP